MLGRHAGTEGRSEPPAAHSCQSFANGEPEAAPGALGRRHVRGGAGARPAARGDPGPHQPPPSGRPYSPRASGPRSHPPSSPASAAQRPFYGRKAGKPRLGRHPVAVLASCSSHRPCGLTGGYEAQTRGGAPEAMEDSRGARRRSSPRGRPPRTSMRSWRRPCRRGLCWAAPSRGVAAPAPPCGGPHRKGRTSRGGVHVYLF